jgi:predicted nucleic acid-binding protein
MLRILVDSSVWIDHLKKSDSYLLELIDAHKANRLVLCAHDLIYSELLLGGLSKNSEVYQLFKNIPKAPNASLYEFEVFVGANKGKIPGIGVIDTHLLISCIISGTKLHTYDKALIRAAKNLGILHTIND